MQIAGALETAVQTKQSSFRDFRVTKALKNNFPFTRRILVMTEEKLEYKNSFQNATIFKSSYGPFHPLYRPLLHLAITASMWSFL